jgi:hypothetical protein
MNATLDLSTRYVLAEDSPIAKNLAALWVYDPQLAREIEGIADDQVYATETSKSGAPTLAARGANGRVYLHSKYAPADEAAKLVAPISTDEHTFFYIHGFGLGYHAELLFEKAGPDALHIIFEPDVRVLRAAFEARDLSKCLDGGRMMFVTQPDKADFFARLEPHMSVLSLGYGVLNHPASRQRAPEFHQTMDDLVEQFAQFCKTNVDTVVINGRKTAENVTKNIGWYAAAPGLGHLKEKHKGLPAIIVSAGPSLRKNKHLLKDAAGKAVIIAVQTTLQPLLEMGVEPDYVTSLDYHEICSRFFEKLPKGIRTELVAEPKATSVIFGLHTGPLALCGNEYAEKLLREMKLDRPTIPGGTTVAHLAYYLAEFAGCDPIIFVGQDLGFSDGLCYTPGTSYEDVWRPELSRFCTVEMKQWEQIARDRAILRRIADVNGRPMYTEQRLHAYLHQFEKDFATSSRTIIDATEGGAFKRGSTPMALADAIERYCKGGEEGLAARGTGVPPVVLECTGETHVPREGSNDWSVLPRVVKSLEKRKEEAMEVERISRDTLPLLQEIHDHIEDQARVNKSIAKIDALRAKMNGLGQCYELITDLTQTTELARFKADREISAAKVKGAELQRRQVGRDIANVRGVAEAAKEFGAMMSATIDSLRGRMV